MDREYLPDLLPVPAEAVAAWAKTHGTPFYLYDEAGLEASISRVQTAFGWNPGYVNYVRLRENPNPALLRLLYDGGSGVSVSNGLELRVARQCGFSGVRLLYAPTRRDPEAEALARSLGAAWLIHAQALLPDAPVPVLYLRVVRDSSYMEPAARRRQNRIKAGFTEAQLREAVVRLRGWTSSEVGLAAYNTSYDLLPGMLASRWTDLQKLARQLQQETGVSIRRFYLGEGPGVVYRPSFTGPTLEEEAGALRTAVGETDCVLSTGICKQVLERHGLLVTSVVECRTVYRNYLVVDAGISQYLRPALHQAYRHISILGKTQPENRRLWQVVGPTDEDLDRFSDGRMLPNCRPGDLCIVHDVGCGGRSSPMLSVGQTVAPEYLYRRDGTIVPISPARSAEDVWTFLYGGL